MFSFFAVSVSSAHAEEEVTDTEESSTEDTDKRGAMLKQIESLRAAIAERKDAMKEKRTDYKEEKKVEHKADKADFMASSCRLK